MTQQVETPRERSWRGIRQAVNPRTMTPQGRRRLGWSTLRMGFAMLTGGALIAGGIYLWLGYERPADTLAPVVGDAEPLREIVVLTDGVLSKSWVLQQLALPENIALMAVDLAAAKTALEAHGQVRTAVIARDFPGTLVVTLEERVPVARLVAARATGERETFFVARDGTVFRGENFDPAMVQRLPYLDGVRLTRRGGEFASLAGMDRVSELLLAAQHEAPHLAEQWRVISLAEQPRIVVRAVDVREIVFEPSQYRRQLAWLDHILGHYRENPPPPPGIRRIDLSIAANAAPGTVPQVAVQFAGSGRRRNVAVNAGAGSLFFTRNQTTNGTNRGY